MIIIKTFTLFLIFLSSTYIGILMSNRFTNRVKDLKEIKSGLNAFKTKIKFTYEPIPTIFKEISKSIKNHIGNIFEKASKNMETMPAGEAWNKAVEEVQTSLTKEDVEILKKLSNLLGKVDLQGQISEIELVENFLETQINLAEEEKQKYTKMYKTLGTIIGLAVVIVLI